MQNQPMKKLLILGIALMGAFAHAAETPNVVFLLSDEQGRMDCGFMGHPLTMPLLFPVPDPTVSL